MTSAHEADELDFTRSYLDYLASDSWHALRSALIETTGDFCKQCGRVGPSRISENAALDAHHLTYSRFGRERLADLVLLCRACHESEHIRRFAQRSAREIAMDIACMGSPRSSTAEIAYRDLIDAMGGLR